MLSLMPVCLLEIHTGPYGPGDRTVSGSYLDQEAGETEGSRSFPRFFQAYVVLPEIILRSSSFLI